MDQSERMETMRVPVDMDTLAPDGSEIRVLVGMQQASFCHCTLPPYRTSLAGMHQELEEVWYCLQGQGQVWRERQGEAIIVDVGPGVCLTIPRRTHFQFRNTGSEPLCFFIATMPPWPGEQGWTRVANHW